MAASAPAGPTPARGAARGLLATRRGRRLLFAALYFAEGAPIGFLWWTLPVILKRDGLGPAEIGALTGALVLPWTFKFAWAPLVDLARGPRFTLRGWIACAQVVMIAGLVPLLWLDLGTSLGAVTACLLVHACAAATQDVAIDALAIQTAGEHELGSLNGWMQAGMLGGRAIFGGAVIALIGSAGAAGIAALLIGALTLTLALHAFYRVPAAAARVPAREYAAALRGVAARPMTWLIVLFAATSGASFEIVGAFAGPFLADRGASDGALATFYGLPVVGALALGALLGGRLADRAGARRAVALAGVGLVACTAVLALDVAGARGTWAVLTALYLAAGGFTASTYALFMAATDRRLAAVQFSAFMGATNLCESWSARYGGRVAGASGYPAAFALGLAVTALALPLLRWVRNPGADASAGR